MIKLEDCQKSFIPSGEGCFMTYRNITNWIKVLINAQVRKTDKVRVHKLEAEALIFIILSAVNYLNKFYSSKNEDGYQIALNNWMEANGK